MAILPIIAAGTQIAGALGGLFGGEDYPEFEAPEIDIEGEIQKLAGIYESQMGALETESVSQQAETRAALASELAARGIYESPVSQQAFSRSRADAARALSLAKAQIRGQQATATSDLQKKLLDYKMRIAEMQYASKVGKYHAGNQNTFAKILSGIGGGLSGMDTASASIADYLKKLRKNSNTQDLSGVNIGIGSGSKLSLY